MNEILIAVIPVVIIGVLCAAVLVIASKLMAVKEDERFPAVRDCLPGANCGREPYVTSMDSLSSAKQKRAKETV